MLCYTGLSGIEAISVASSKPFGRCNTLLQQNIMWCIDTAEKEAAFTMCMISNTPDRNTTPVTPSNNYLSCQFICSCQHFLFLVILHAIELDHSYAKKPPKSRGYVILYSNQSHTFISLVLLF